MNVLSLFDGISCGMLALLRGGGQTLESISPMRLTETL